MSAGPREDALTVGGQKLHLEHHEPQGRPLGTVVSVHGYAAHSALYRHLGARLAAAGFWVTQFDCRGHGRSSGRRGHVARFGDYLEDLSAVASRARELAPAGSLAFVGHSHGATIVLAFLLDPARGPAPDRVVLAAPYLALAMPVPAVKRIFGPLMARVWPTLTMHNEIRAENVSRNPLVVQNFDRDPLVHHVATAGWFHEVRRAQTRIRAAAGELRVPALLLVAGQDKIVSAEAALEIAAAAGPTIDVRKYEGLYHELFLEPEADRVIEDIAAWLTRGSSAGSARRDPSREGVGTL